MTQAYDLIGDIHGEAAVLRDLLARLGYAERGGSYRHPERRVIFLGDYVDRGPGIRETLHIIRRMVDEDQAIALCGNHELDVLLHDSPDGRGGWLGPRGGRKTAMHARTHADFADRPKEWRGWLEWLQTLPLYLDLPGLRAVHAYWNSRLLAALGGQHRLAPEFLREVAERQTAAGQAVHRLLKGPELTLPEEHATLDGNGNLRRDVRVRWWFDGRGRTCREACINQYHECPDVPVPEGCDELVTPPDPDDRRPLFIGHYWLPARQPQRLTSTIACLDHSVAAGGPLVAYRWDGEAEIDPNKFVLDPRRLRA